ncbi:MAG: hypothetical protein WC269_01005 [Candidatus Gracilibacteria bacterium]|jgi:hypothetical protein
MIIHCISCGKAISSEINNCPYCTSEITEFTLEVNGHEEKKKIKEKMLNLMFGLVQK